MSERVRELTERQRRLEARCAAQRRAIADEVRAVEERFGAFDRVAGLARSQLLRPAVVVAGVLALLMIGRVRGVRFIGRALLLGAAARRLLQAAKRL